MPPRVISPDHPEPPTLGETLFGTPKERLSFYRSEIQYEMTLLSSRTNAYLTAQSFLVIAYATSMANTNPQWGGLFTLVMPLFLSVLGVMSSLHAWPGISASIQIIRHWNLKQDHLLRSDLNFGWAYDESPLLSESASSLHGVEKSLLFSRRSPLLFIAAWLVLALLTLFLHLCMG